MTKPNPNPFIGETAVDTLSRVESGLVFLQDLEILRSSAADTDRESEACLSTTGAFGYHLVIDTLRYAVNHEVTRIVAEKDAPVREVS